MKIKIIQMGALGPQFDNLQPGTEHEIITPPEGATRNSEKSVWVMGNGEPVMVFTKGRDKEAVILGNPDDL